MELGSAQSTRQFKDGRDVSALRGRQHTPAILTLWEAEAGGSKTLAQCGPWRRTCLPQNLKFFSGWGGGGSVRRSGLEPQEHKT